MSDELIQYILGSHWEGRRATRIAAAVRLKFHRPMSAGRVVACIEKYSLRHHGKPVERKNWPCK